MVSLNRSARERTILDGLGPHTRAHVLAILDGVPDLTLTSGRRSPAVNRRVGGSPRSYHLKGRAADFVGSRRALEDGARLAKGLRLGAACTGPEEVLIHDSGSGVHLHVAF